MSGKKLELVLAHDGRSIPPEGWTRALFQDALKELKAFRGLAGWRAVRLVVDNPKAVPQPAKTALALLLLSPSSAEIVSANGEIRRRITFADIFSEAVDGARSRDAHLKAMKELFAWLDASPVRQESYAPAAGAPMALRTGLWFGAKVGGAFSHAAGIINAIHDVFGAVDLLATDSVPCLRPEIVSKRIDLAQVKGWNTGVGVHFAANEGLLSEARRLSGSGAPAFIYQRGGLGDLSGLRLARQYRRPFVLEYNGPEVWVADNWGDGIPYKEEFQRVETELLRRADIVLAVSAPLVEDAINRGADANRVLLSPNAVDPERFTPDIDGATARAKYGFGARRAALLLSSFGPWHGVEKAVEAYAALLKRRPELAAETTLVLAGHGQGHAAAQKQAQAAGLRAGETVIFTSVIPSEEAPALMAASEILLSPQTENPDGSVFFGSPTKIFEYMAMARPIIASRLAQIGEVLEHERTALLVPPGDAQALSAALERAFTQPEGVAAFGPAARAEAIRAHSWTARIEELRAGLARLGAL